jgi:hypothetical protein
MMWNAEFFGQLASEQFGSRSGHRAIEQAWNKRLSFYLVRQQRRTAALCSNDMKSCYDQVVHSVASIAMEPQNVPDTACICMFTTLQNLEHTVRTIYGNSDTGYGGTLWAVPSHGLGQGNGAGPTLWAVVSTPLLNQMRQMGFGFFYQTCILNEELHFVGYSFIDDTDTIQSEQYTQDPTTVAHNMQSGMDTWEGGIRFTGGALEPRKSFWYLLSFFWDEGVWRYTTVEETPSDI